MANKRLIVCFDGTWKKAEDKGHASNVVRLMRLLDDQDAEGRSQVIFYDKGVGTGNLLDRLSGGIMGRGLEQNVRDGYIFLGNNWTDGDEIYLFGFSRGAYTARVLAGLIGHVGILGREDLGYLNDAWDRYHNEDRRPRIAYDKQGTKASHAEIRLVGVWDTVAALGLPFIGRRFRDRRYGFTNTLLGRCVNVGLQALAIDEHRRPYKPLPWTGIARVPEDAEAPCTGVPTIEQVWLPGAHTDVGGGYLRRELANLSLAWMVERVRAYTDLAFVDGWQEAIFPDGEAFELAVHDSMNLGFRLLVPVDRLVGAQPGVVLADQQLHPVAPDLYGSDVPVLRGKDEAQRGTLRYPPSNLRTDVAERLDVPKLVTYPPGKA